MLRRAAQARDSRLSQPYGDHRENILQELREEAEMLLYSRPMPSGPRAVTARADQETQRLVAEVTCAGGRRAVLEIDRARSPRLWNKAALAMSAQDLETLEQFLLAEAQQMPAAAFSAPTEHSTPPPPDCYTPLTTANLSSTGDSDTVERARALVAVALGEPVLSILRAEVVDRLVQAIADAVTNGELTPEAHATSAT